MLYLERFNLDKQTYANLQDGVVQHPNDENVGLACNSARKAVCWRAMSMGSFVLGCGMVIASCCSNNVIAGVGGVGAICLSRCFDVAANHYLHSAERLGGDVLNRIDVVVDEFLMAA
jgi:hypothetical protein